MLQRVPLFTRLPPAPSPVRLFATPPRCDRLAFSAQPAIASEEHTVDEPVRVLSHGSSPPCSAIISTATSSSIATPMSTSTAMSLTSTPTPASPSMAIEMPILSLVTTAPTSTLISTSTSSMALGTSILTSASPVAVTTPSIMLISLSALTSSSIEATTVIPSTAVLTSISASTSTSLMATARPISSSSLSSISTSSLVATTTTLSSMSSTAMPTSPPSTSSLITPSSASPLSSNKDVFLINSSFLSCCDPGEQLKVGVLLSGGVDSSVALRLLLAAGHSCTAFYLKIWFQEDFENFWSSCPWEEDLKFAQAVCDEAGVELQVVELTDEYWKNVVSYMIAEYEAGRTPNPDILCNSRIKFGVFLEHVKNMGFDRVASGHYAKVVRKTDGSDGVQAVLQLSKDEVKDQTYFLSHLSQFQLSQLMFPLGCISKAEVRQIADKLGLPNKQRKDSQGICFLGKVKFSDFICRHLGEREGRILEAETGTYLGNHKGFWFYTIGQRQGLRLSDGPWYVVDKDQENNVVFVSKKYFSVDKKRRIFEVHTFNWFGGQPGKNLSGLRCKVRHGPRFYECSLVYNKSPVLEEECTTYTSALVHLSEDDQGLAAGQYAAFYKEDVCLGSGVISEFRADRSSAVSSEAREAAKMKELPVIKQSKSKKRETSSAHKKIETDVEHGDRPMPQETFPWWLLSLQKFVKKCLNWIQSS